MSSCYHKREQPNTLYNVSEIQTMKRSSYDNEAAIDLPNSFLRLITMGSI
jgi:hypothetical protein